MDKITADAVTEIQHNDSLSVPSSSFTPNLQILNLKNLSSKSNANNVGDKYRVALSDGKHFMQGMLSSQVGALVNRGELQRFDIVKLTKFACNNIQSRKIIIVLELKIVSKMSEKIGQPVSIEPVPKQNEENSISNPQNEQQSLSSHNKNIHYNKAPEIKKQEYHQSNMSGSFDNNSAYKTPTFNNDIQNNFNQTNQNNNSDEEITSIISINPFQNKWKIKARLSTKSELRHFKNAKGDGKVFSVVFIDHSGEIRATGFNESADSFYSQLEVGKVYYLSGCRVATAKKQFNNVNNEYELFFQNQTAIEECYDNNTSNIPTMKFSFTKLSELEQFEVNDMIDVICVIDAVYPLTELRTKTTQQLISKRDLMVVDSSSYAVRLTLWSAQANEITEENKGEVLCIKGAKVGEFNGKNLSLQRDSTYQINPDIEEAYSLKAWYSSNSNKTFESLSRADSTRIKNMNFDEIQSISTVKELNYGASHVQTDSFVIKPTVIYIKSDQISYPSCQNDKCKKKVYLSGSLWHCEKCDQTFTQENYRYNVSIHVADYSGEMWLRCFEETACKIFGLSANDAERLKADSMAGEYNNLITKASFQQFVIKCKAKEDIYNDIATIRYIAESVVPIDHAEHGRLIVNEIEQVLAQ